MPVRGIRGATTVERDTPEDILAASRELLAAIVQSNQIEPDDSASVLFTTTPDLSGDYPAHAARELGWNAVPLLGATEMHVPGALARCIRVLLHVNTSTPPADRKSTRLNSSHSQIS